MGWLEDLAATFGTDPLGPDETTDLLDAARDVAHGVERKVTPLATFLLGMRVQAAVAAGEDRRTALDRAIGDLRGTLPEG